MQIRRPTRRGRGLLVRHRARWTFSVFTFSYVATRGGPAYATWFYVLHLFHNAFEYLQMGYASALSWILFVVLLGFTFLQFRSARRWVYYAGEAKADE